MESNTNNTNENIHLNVSYPQKRTYSQSDDIYSPLISTTNKQPRIYSSSPSYIKTLLTTAWK